jgi:hypothetical protein
MAQNPCFLLPLLIPLLSFRFLLLTWKPSFGVMRSRPPWSQVTRKLTSPFSSPPHPLPIQNSQHFRSIVRLTKTTSGNPAYKIQNRSCLGLSDTVTCKPFGGNAENSLGDVFHLLFQCVLMSFLFAPWF